MNWCSQFFSQFFQSKIIDHRSVLIDKWISPLYVFFFEITEPLLPKSQKLVLQHDVIKNMSCKPSKSLIKAFSSVFYVTLPYKCLKLTKIRKVDIRKKLDIRNFSLLTKMFLISRVDCTGKLKSFDSQMKVLVLG